MKTDSVILVLITLIAGSVVIIQTVKSGAPPAWFETSIVPILVATILTIKFGMEQRNKDGEKKD